MSDINIPGVSNRYNTTQMIQDLMEVERTRLERLENTATELDTQRTVWQDMNRMLGTLRETARTLTSFENPFNDKIATTSDEAVLTVEASRAANEGEWELEVVQEARGDRMLSGNIDLEQEVPRGDYSFFVGEEEVSFSFRGGKLERFVDKIREEGEDILSANLIRNTSTSQVLLLEGLEVGAANRISFGDNSRDLMISLGILEENRTDQRDITLSEDTVSSLSGSPEEVLFNDQGMSLEPQKSVSIPISPILTPTEDMILEAEITLTRIPESSQPLPEPPAGLDSGEPGTVSFEGITINNNPIQDNLPTPPTPEPPPIVQDMAVVYAGYQGRSVSLGEIQDITATQRIQIPLKDYLSNLDHLEIRNNNSLRQLSITNIRIYDPTVQGDVRPVNPLSQARDAIVKLEGVEVIRETNEIDDLIPGLTLNVRGASSDPVNIDIEPDRESIKNALITMVGSYNQALAEINILTNRNSQVVEEIGYFTDEERESAMERLGMFQGDLTLNQLKNRLQRIFQDPYQTSDPNLNLLAQIGISTNASNSTGFDSSRLRGYLEINEETLDRTLETNVDAVKDLFGRDTNGDLVLDTGVAFMVDEQVRPYTQLGGFLANKVSNLDRNIQDQDREIEEFNDYLVEYETELRRRYGMMEGVLNSMEGTFNALDNFNRQNSGN